MNHIDTDYSVDEVMNEPYDNGSRTSSQMQEEDSQRRGCNILDTTNI